MSFRTVLVAVVVAATGLTFRAPAVSGPQPPSAAPSSAVAATATIANADPESLQSRILGKEREGLDALKAGHLAAFADLLAEDAVLIDDHGPATKAEVVQHTANFRLTDYSMADIRFIPLSPNSGLLIYTLTEKGTSRGKEFSAKAYVSSLWAERNTKWQCLFSQETLTR